MHLHLPWCLPIVRVRVVVMVLLPVLAPVVLLEVRMVIRGSTLTHLLETMAMELWVVRHSHPSKQATSLRLLQQHLWSLHLLHQR